LYGKIHQANLRKKQIIQVLLFNNEKNKKQKTENNCILQISTINRQLNPVNKIIKKIVLKIEEFVNFILKLQLKKKKSEYGIKSTF
jgi:hypothetical protein